MCITMLIPYSYTFLYNIDYAQFNHHIPPLRTHLLTLVRQGTVVQRQQLKVKASAGATWHR